MTEGKTETVVKEVDIHRETDAAYQISFPEQGKDRYWFPKSQVELYNNGLKEMMSIPTWLYNKKLAEDE